MKYKVGDRVKIVSERTAEMNQRGAMDQYLGTVMTINRCIDDILYPYKMKEDNGIWEWREDMIEGLAAPELTAEEAIQWLGEHYNDRTFEAVFGFEFTMSDLIEKFAPREISEKIVQWKADQGKKEPEIETVDICRIIETLPDGTKRCVHEEDIKTDPDFPFGGGERETVEEMLKSYCMEHEGNFIAVHEVVSRVKETN